MSANQRVCASAHTAAHLREQGLLQPAEFKATRSQDCPKGASLTGRAGRLLVQPNQLGQALHRLQVRLAGVPLHVVPAGQEDGMGWEHQVSGTSSERTRGVGWEQRLAGLATVATAQW